MIYTPFCARPILGPLFPLEIVDESAEITPAMWDSLEIPAEKLRALKIERELRLDLGRAVAVDTAENSGKIGGNVAESTKGAVSRETVLRSNAGLRGKSARNHGF